MTQTITCPLCDLHFDAEELVEGECAECWNEYIWVDEGNGIVVIWESDHADGVWEITKMIS